MEKPTIELRRIRRCRIATTAKWSQAGDGLGWRWMGECLLSFPLERCNFNISKIGERDTHENDFRSVFVAEIEEEEEEWNERDPLRVARRFGGIISFNRHPHRRHFSIIVVVVFENLKSCFCGAPN